MMIQGARKERKEEKEEMRARGRMTCARAHAR